MKYKNYASDSQLLPYLILIALILLISLGYNKINDTKLTASNLNFSTILENYNKIFNLSDSSFPDQKITQIKINKGDTLTKILLKNKIDHKTAGKITLSLNKLFDLKKLYLGQELTLIIDKKTGIDYQGKEYNFFDFAMLRVKIDHFNYVEVINQDGEFISKKTPIILKKYITKIQGTIDNSFIETATKLGIPAASINLLTKYYSYDVDFQRDIKNGDEVELMFERYYDQQGSYSHDGDVIFSSLVLGDKKFNLYRFPNQNGETEYFSDEGFSVKKELLRTPLNVTKISSGFGVRKHPVLGYSKMHKGIDFAASIGTPIFAAGSGSIEEIGHKGAYGNYIKIRHGNGYSTAYAHASSFVKNLKKGSKVKQGDVIAYVGATGRTTGPHLHYEVLINNQNVNPLSIKSKPNVQLSGDNLKRFNKHKIKIKQLATKITDIEDKAEIEVSGI